MVELGDLRIEGVLETERVSLVYERADFPCETGFEIGYFSPRDMVFRSLEQYLSESLLSFRAGGWRGELSEEMFRICGEGWPVGLPVVCVAGGAQISWGN